MVTSTSGIAASRFSGSTGDLLTAGIYTLRDAARLTRVPPAAIRRWTLGYSFVRRGETRNSPPLVKPQLRRIDGEPALSFLDLQELRLLYAFRSRGASWHTLRLAHEEAKRQIGHPHPFATGKFLSAGREILSKVALREGDHALENVVSRQLVFRRFIAPYLRGLEFDDHVVIRWYPRRDRRVIVAPKRNFGQPFVREGVPTQILERSYRTEHSFERVANWYDVALSSVRAAVEFERRRAA